MAFMDLHVEKEFDRVPPMFMWWMLRKQGVKEWIVSLVKGIYINERTCVHASKGYSQEFEVKVVVFQGSIHALHHRVAVLVTQVLLWSFLGRPLYR